jgi:serine/threonine-protein kinase RsbW
MPDTRVQQPLKLMMPSEAAEIKRVRHAVEDYARTMGFPTEAADAVGLCVNEALANVIRHAYHGEPGCPIAVTASVEPGESLTLRITIRDWGEGADPTTKPAKPYNALEPGGVGLVCLNQLMDVVMFTPQSDGMLLTLIKRVDPHTGDDGTEKKSESRR